MNMFYFLKKTYITNLNSKFWQYFIGYIMFLTILKISLINGIYVKIYKVYYKNIKNVSLDYLHVSTIFEPLSK